MANANLAEEIKGYLEKKNRAEQLEKKSIAARKEESESLSSLSKEAQEILKLVGGNGQSSADFPGESGPRISLEQQKTLIREALAAGGKNAKMTNPELRTKTGLTSNQANNILNTMVKSKELEKVPTDEKKEIGKRNTSYMLPKAKK